MPYIRRFRVGHSRADQGSTLVVAMMVMAIAAGLSLMVTSVAISQNRSSGVDRQRTVAVDAAEGGIDATYAVIQSSGVSLPCRWPATGSANMKAFPDATQVVATVTYSATAGGPALPCVGGVLPPGSLPVAALISSTATTPTLAGNSTRGIRTMQASVNLVPIRGDGFSKAIFGENTIIASNHSDVTGSSGPNANLYTNGNFVCSNNQNYQGAIIAPNGSIDMAGCSVATDVWARDGITVSNGTIGGKVISSAGAVSLTGNTSVGGTVLASGAIDWPGCSTTGKCFANQGSAAPPSAAEQFPILRSDPGTLQAWADAGYTVLAPDNNCSLGAAAFGAKVKASAQSVTTKTLFRTNCAVQFSNSKDIDFGTDYALFASGGITTSNQVTLDSTGPLRSVYFIVPYDAASRPCTTPGISTSNNFGSTSAINLLVYSPCNVTYSNNGTPSQGQVYSGSTVQINNNYALTFAQMPIFGIDPASLPTLSYTVDILYKREVLNP